MSRKAWVKFAIEFVEGKAKNVVLDFSALDSASADLYGEAIASRFFEYVLGWNPPIWSELNFSAFGAVIEESLEYCLGDGVATSWKTAQLSGRTTLIDDPKLYYDPACEPPYDAQ